MNTATTPPALEPPTPTAQTPSSAAGRKLLAELIKFVPVIGPPLAAAVADAAIGPIALRLLPALLWTLLVYPLALVLAVCWLLQSSWFPTTLRQYYVQQVRSGFKVEDAAREISNWDNQHLDYFQVVEMNKSTSDPQTFTLHSEKYQRIIIRPKAVHIQSLDPKACPLPKGLSNRPLYSLKAGNIEIGPLTEGQTSGRVEIDHAQWDKLAGQFDGDIPVTLAVLDSLPEKAKDQLDCASVVTDVRLAVEVFKDSVKEPAAGKEVTP